MSRQKASTGRPILARKIAIDLAIMSVIGFVIALLGPFGSFALPFSVRLISWLGFAYIGYGLYSPMGGVVKHFARRLDLPEVGLWVVACLAASVPMTCVVWTMSHLPNFPPPLPKLEWALTLYFYVLVLGGAVTALFYMLEKRKEERLALADAVGGEGGEEVSAPPLRRLFERLPPALGTDLLALEMEDHYVRAHTVLGSELILMRLGDAIAELGDLEGRQVHRSWWVARGAVENVKREGRNIRLVLSGGLEAPVSRANVSVLKEAGWI